MKKRKSLQKGRIIVLHCRTKGIRIVVGNVNYGIGMINVNILKDKP